MSSKAIKDILNQIDNMLINYKDLSSERLNELLVLKSILQKDLINELEKQIKGVA